MKNYLAIVSMMFIFLQCKAQQEILYTQYIFSQLAVNPAYAGNKNDLSITAINRKQWIGLEGAPNSVSLFADGAVLGRNPAKDRNFHQDRRFPLFSGNKQLGLGLVLFNDKIGVNNSFQASLAYSYKINFSDYTRLSFGLQTGILNFNQSLDKLQNINVNDVTFANNLNAVRFNVGSGAFFETEHYFLGFSVPSIIKNNLDPTDIAGERQLRQYFFSAGYLLYIHPLYKLKPTIMIRHTDNMPTQFDLNLYLLYNDRIWTGISYSYKNSINISGEILLSESFNVGLAYDFGIGEIRRVNMGTAEVLINYTFRQPKKRIINPRYF